jgi:hypothetical protein
VVPDEPVLPPEVPPIDVPELPEVPEPLVTPVVEPPSVPPLEVVPAEVPELDELVMEVASGAPVEPAQAASETATNIDHPVCLDIIATNPPPLSETAYGTG